MFKLYKKYLKKNLHLVIIGPLFKVVEAIFELLVPFIIRNMINKGINNDLLTYPEKKEYIIGQGLLLLLFAVIGLLSTLVCQFIASRVSQTFGTDLRNDLYKHINTLSFKELDTLQASSIINRETNDIYNVEKSVAILIRLVIRSPLIVVGSIILSFFINVTAGIIFIVSAILIFMIFYFVTKFTYPNNKKAQKQMDKVTTIAKDNLTGSRQVRAFCKEDVENSRFEEGNDLFTKFQLKVGKINAYLNPLTFVICNITIVLLIYLGGFKIGSDLLNQGDILALMNYQTQIFVAIVAVTGLVQTFTKASASSERINQLFSLKSSLVTGGEKEGIVDSDIISFTNVSFKYNTNAKPSLENISFSVKEGETIGIIGPTGSGKSTLAYLIAHFYDTTSGDVFYKGKNVKVYEKDFYTSQVSFVFQHASLFKGSIKSNLMWGKDSSSIDEINHALDVAQADFAKDNLESMVLQNGQNLSGGQKQRLSIARALLKKSPILILDDASSALDYKTDYKLRMALKKESYTTFIVAQRAKTLASADKIIVLDNGKLVGFGTSDDLLKTCKTYQDIWALEERSEANERN